MAATETQTQWYYDNHEREKAKRREYSREFRRANPARRMLAAAKDRAKAKGLPFDLTLNDVIIPVLCPVFGVPLVQHTAYAPSLDRIEPEKGYVKGNVQVISRKANLMKQDASLEELRRFAEWVKTSVLL